MTEKAGGATSTPQVYHLLLGSLSNNVFERRTSTGSGLFSFFDGGFAQIFSQIASITVKKLRNTNFISSRHVKRENTSLPVDVRRSKTSLLKLPIVRVVMCVLYGECHFIRCKVKFFTQEVVILLNISFKTIFIVHT